MEKVEMKNPEILKREASDKFGVNLDDLKEVMRKMSELQGKMPDVAELSNLWREYEDKKAA
jgi:hypothetical protein